MNVPKRHRPGWLKFMFGTVAAAALSASATIAHAQDNDATEPGLDYAGVTELSTTTAQTTAPDLIASACSQSDIVLVGDTDHTSLPVHRAMFGDATMDALAECGVGTVFIEISQNFQPELDKFMSGEIDMDTLREKYTAFSGNMHNMSKEDYAAKHDADLAMFAHVKELGLRLVAADPQNGAGEGFMVALMMNGAFNKIKQGLPEEFKPYHDLFLDGRENEIPEKDREAFNEAFAKLYQSEEIQHLFAKADEIKDEFAERRTNDTQLVAAITNEVGPGDKAVVIYGAGHFANTRDVGIDALLQDKGYKVARVDLYESTRKVAYEQGADLPGFVYIAETGTALTLKAQPDAKQNAPAAPKPAQALKSDI